MFVAALLAACPDLALRVFDDLKAVLPEGVIAALEEGESGALAVQRFHVAGEGPRAGDGHGTAFAPLVRRIEAAVLHPGTAAAATAILTRLAEAEATVHGVAVETVHFHEVADWDSLADVIAAGSIAAALDGARWSVSALPRGDGLVRTRHGLLPVPAPATVALLHGFAWRDDGVGGERVTPTGAAILAHLCGDAAPSGTLRAVGQGAGTRSLPGIPNILRAMVFEAAPAAAGRDTVAVLTFDVDDMSGEEIAVAADHLRAADGVLDVSLGGRLGKKGRPLTEFGVLARPERAEAVAALCLDETSTLGLRWRTEDRIVVERSGDAVEADGLTLRRKRAARPGGATVKVESDDLAPHPTLAARRALRTAGERT